VLDSIYALTPTVQPMAKKSAAEETEAAAPADKVTKADAVRAAIKAGADKPQDAIPFIKEKFGIEISAQHFSSYKSSFLKKAGKAPGRPGRKPKSETTEAAAPMATTSNGQRVGKRNAGGAAELARQVRTLVTQYGADEVAGMVAVMAE
jgi:hypothetical protein